MPVLLFLRALGMGVFGLLRKLEPFQLLSLVLGIALLFVGAQRNGARHDRDAWHRQFTAEHKLRATDRASYEAAQRQAAANNQAKIHQIETQQDAINEKTRSQYSRDLDRLRAQSRADQGSAGGSKAPGVPKAAPGTHADGLPTAPCDNLCASEIELRLMYLQNWVADQLKVER